MTSLAFETTSDQSGVSQFIDEFLPLDVSGIARLTDDSIQRMDNREMARVVRAVRTQHLRPGVAELLVNYPVETLRSLVVLTHRWCRQQQAFRPQSVHRKERHWST